MEMRNIIACGLGVLLVGCASPNRVVPADSYLIDTKRGVMCHISECYELEHIQSSHDELNVALAFGLPVRPYSWSTSEFTSLLVSPPNKLYSVEKLSNTEYRIPKNEATDRAFDLIYTEDFYMVRIE
jgi:hypothetical protein